MGNFSRFHENPEELCLVIAFDPGETTGYCIMGVPQSCLINDYSRPLHDAIRYNGHIEYGEIDCRTGSSVIEDYERDLINHAGIGLINEAIGVSSMISLVEKFDNPAIVLEDFIVDMNRIDQARHTLSPVRIISAFFYGMWNAKIPVYDHTFIQNRSLAKTTCTDLRLKNWGLYDRNSGPHARDATRHAYYFLRNCRGQTMREYQKRWRAWPDKFESPNFGESRRENKPKKIGTRIESIK